jgi:sialate O-acetylesterase
MTPRRSLLVVLTLAAGAAWPPAARGAEPESAAPFVSPIFGDDMVLQRGKLNRIWGWTRAGEHVTVAIDGRSAAAVAGPDGRWEAAIAPPPVGRECVIAVDGSRHAEFHRVLVGDVWLCGGQSNMQFALLGAKDGGREVAAANHPNIRFFKVESRVAYDPVQTVKGAWKVCSPQSVAENGGFSAVAYFFGRRLEHETGVPIGLIEDCLGGTPVECWMDPKTLAARGDFDRPLAELERLRRDHAPAYGSYLMHWLDAYDGGNQGRTWADPDWDDRNWKTVPIDRGFAAFGLSSVPAVCWFRKEVTLPNPLPLGDATLRLGSVEKMDTAYLNGHWVGASSWVENPRVYRVPAADLKPGRNLIAVRVFKLKSANGFLDPPATLQLEIPGGAVISLAGDWKGAVSVDARPPHALPLGYENYPTMPSVLYLGMIRPIAPLALQGAIWYQGEANSSRAHQYRSLLPALIGDWRSAFGQGDFPFFIVSLPAFEARREQPGDDDWAELREAQALTAATVPHSGLAVTIDTGDPNTIHPTDKQPVGDRLALLALANCYGQSVVYRGPTFRSVERSGRELRVLFDHTDGGLAVRGEKLGEFSVAGTDRKWHWAQARIDGESVVVSAPEVAEPTAVRYAWQANPAATLFNGAGLPAVPFRSDDWPGVTDHRDPW